MLGKGAMEETGESGMLVVDDVGVNGEGVRRKS